MIMLQTQHSFHIHPLHDFSSQLYSACSTNVHVHSTLHARHAHLGRSLAWVACRVAFMHLGIVSAMRANMTASSSPLESLATRVFAAPSLRNRRTLIAARHCACRVTRTRIERRIDTDIATGSSRRQTCYPFGIGRVRNIAAIKRWLLERTCVQIRSSVLSHRSSAERFCVGNIPFFTCSNTRTWCSIREHWLHSGRCSYAAQGQSLLNASHVYAISVSRVA
jgi:hypothetical protein